MIMQRLKRGYAANHTLLKNASSMVGTTLVTSVLGFAYWWLAARRFSAEAVGLAAAAISAMMLIGTISMLGLGTLLIGELPRQVGRRTSLILTALIFVAFVGTVCGLLFAWVVPWLVPDLQPLSKSIESAVLFALGACLTAITLVLDQAMIGLLRGELQLGRNALFAVAKLVILLVVSGQFSDLSGLTIYAAWAAGNGVSLMVLAGFVFRQGTWLSACRPQWDLLRRLGWAALGHHALNLALQAPALILPVVVTALLSARLNAFFYTAWMMAMFVFVGPLALTTVLYAIGRATPAIVAHKMRSTLKLSMLVGALGCATLLIGAEFILRLFGEAYADNAAWCLRLLGLGVFPLIIKNHYVAICRIRDRVNIAALLLAGGGLIELILAALFAGVGGLTGLGLGYVLGLCIEAVFMSRTVYRAAFPLHDQLGEDQTAPSTPIQLPARPAG